MVTRKLHVPAFRDESASGADPSVARASTVNGFTSVVVVRWGRVAGFTFRAGDRVVLGPVEDGGLLLLRPRGYGWPMLGRQVRGSLIAEPGGVPAAPRRWRVAGGVVAVERRLGRGVTDGGRWFVEVRVTDTAGRVRSADAVESMGLTGGWLTGPQVDALCHRATRWEGRVAVAAVNSPEQARELLRVCPAGSIRLAADRSLVAGSPSVIAGPWSAPPAQAAPASSTTDGLGDYDRPRPLAAQADSPSVTQLSLFGPDRRTRAS